MSAVSAALDLRQIPESDYAKLVNEAAAVRYCCEHSGLQDKTIAIEVGTDPATLSKAKAGQARLSDHQLALLEDLTGLRGVLFAALLCRGFDPRSLRRWETDVERENRELRERIEALEKERQIERRTVREILGARP